MWGFNLCWSSVSDQYQSVQILPKLAFKTFSHALAYISQIIFLYTWKYTANAAQGCTQKPELKWWSLLGAIGNRCMWSVVHVTWSCMLHMLLLLGILIPKQFQHQHGINECFVQSVFQTVCIISKCSSFQQFTKVAEKTYDSTCCTLSFFFIIIEEWYCTLFWCIYSYFML